MEHRNHKQLKANALYIVVVIALFVALILSGLILNTGITNTAIIKHNQKNDLILNCKNGLEYILASKDMVANGPIDLFNDGSKNIKFESTNYGILHFVKITAFTEKDTLYKSHLIGQKSIHNDSTSIHVVNSNKSIGICGKTKLVGKLTIPQKGIERVYIEGQNFVGSKMFHGIKKTANNHLPPIHPSLQALLDKIYKEKSNTVFPLDSTKIEVYDTIVKYYSNNALLLDQEIKGNVIIESGQKITILNAANLINVIVKAPAVEFEQGFMGSVQVFATDSIIVNDDCTFNYPSFFTLKTKTSNNFTPSIYIGESCNIQANLILLQENFKLKNNGIITINHNSKINGTIYSEGYTQLKNCSIEGNVYSKKLYLKTNASVYENTLLNVEVDALKKDSLALDLGLQKKERSWILLK